MRKASLRHSLKQLPKLEWLLIDTDVNPYLARYLGAIGFDVVFAAKVKVDYRDDIAIIKWARNHNRIVVTHDIYRDRATKIRACQEIYENGGQVIQVSRGQSQTPLTSLGKILMHREDWVKFFQDNDGIFVVYQTKPKPMPREYLLRNIQGQFDGELAPVVTLKLPRRQKIIRRKPKPIPPERSRLLP